MPTDETQRNASKTLEPLRLGLLETKTYKEEINRNCYECLSMNRDILSINRKGDKSL